MLNELTDPEQHTIAPDEGVEQPFEAEQQPLTEAPVEVSGEPQKTPEIIDINNIALSLERQLKVLRAKREHKRRVATGIRIGRSLTAVGYTSQPPSHRGAKHHPYDD